MHAQLSTTRRLLAVIPLLAMVAACGPGTGDLGPVATPAPTPGDSIVAPSPEPTPGATGPAASPASPGASLPASTTVRAYFFLGSFTGNAGLVPVLREVAATKAVGTAAIQALLAGPNETELGASPAMYTDIPSGTKLLSLSVDHGVAIVSLSKEFEAGGDPTTIRGRTAQLVFALTQFPTITAVRLLIDDDLPHLASLVSPFSRSSFTDQLPAIWVDRPAWGGVLGSPGRVTGLANVFEAQFRVQVLDGAGRSLLDTPATATCGTGCWGTFDVTVRYVVGTAQWGTLRVDDRSAKDGSTEHVVDYPVWLTP
jgi:hypothetical protein